MKLHKIVVVTDVDGCLTNHGTCDFGESREAIERLEAAAIPLVLCSSKTRAELERLQQELRIHEPFIVENGGALYVPRGTFPSLPPGGVRRNGYDIVEFGKPRREVLRVLRQVAERERLPVVTFSEMSVQEVAQECGLSLAEARLAKLREYDEPFRLVTADDQALVRLRRALASAGLICLRGGHFDHVTAGAHKGLATALLRRCYRRAAGDVTMAGLGDGLDDAELLAAVDLPFVVRGTDDAVTEKVARLVRRAQVTVARGPAGWAEAINGLLDRLPGEAGSGDSVSPKAAALG